MTRVRVVLLGALLAGALLAQQVLTNDSIIKLVKAGMSDDVIVGMVNTQPANFSLTTDDLIALKTAGVSQKVIASMLTKGAAPSATPAPSPAAAPEGTGPVHEIGVYYKKTGVWTDMEPEVVSFKTGGVMKGIASGGLVKGDINGHIKGASSNLQVTTPVEILIYVPEGIAATEYQLLYLHEQGNSREFRTVTGGVFHQSGGASRDAIPFDSKKIAPRTYAITLAGIKPGEYGLLPPASGDSTGSSGRIGKIYSFHLIE